jgi:predicted nucleotidyltransferase
MQSLKNIKKTLQNNKLILVKKYGIKDLAIFGSYARNEQNQESDIDILVDFKNPVGIEFIDLAEELEQILKLKVDLVSKRGLKKEYFASILPELQYV